MNITWVTTAAVASSHQLPALNIVTDDCLANTLFVIHITVHSKWCQPSLAIWINPIASATAVVFGDFRAGSRGWLATVMSTSHVPRLALAWIGSTFIGTCSIRVTFVCLFFSNWYKRLIFWKERIKTRTIFVGDVGFLPQVSPQHAIDKEILFFTFVYLIQPSNRVFYEGGTGSGSEER